MLILLILLVPLLWLVMLAVCYLASMIFIYGPAIFEEWKRILYEIFKGGK